jgi:hypothetical protein
VARGVLHGPPYAGAAALLEYAALDWAALDGLALLSGCDLTKLPLPRMLNVVYAFLIKHLSAEKRAELDARLFPEEVDEETWGEGLEAQAEQDAAMALLGAG